MTFSQVLQEWWHVIVFAASGGVAFVLGKERNRWKIDQLGKELEKAFSEIEKMENKVDALKDEAGKNATHLGNAVAILQTQTTNILTLLVEVRDELRNKADK